ncbi:MAG: TIR domain-containing protein [Bdellovibrionota bacterium]
MLPRDEGLRSIRLTSMRQDQKTHDYDVCLSFAGENREYVRKVADALQILGVRVFFDEYAEVDLWGKDLYTHLDDVYQNAARYCVLFVSKQYAKRVWTNHERESAQARAIRENREYILPVRFDSTAIPGLKATIGYIHLKGMKPSKLARLIRQKVGDHQRKNFFPPIPDRLLEKMKAKSAKAQRRVTGRAYNFFKKLMRLSEEERNLVFIIFEYGCPAELPENIHINIDFLQRIAGLPVSRISRVLKGISSLGFKTEFRNHNLHDTGDSNEKVIVLEWHDMSTNNDVWGNATGEVDEMIKCATDGYCEEHSLEGLRNLDFSQLSSATYKAHAHVKIEKADIK